MSILHSIQCITFEVNSSIKVHFVKSLHWDFILAAISESIILGLKLQIMLHRSARISSLLVFSWRYGGCDGPKSYEYRNAREQSEE